MEGITNQGYIIAFVGPDGSGKTTMCEVTDKYLQANNMKTKYMYGSKKQNQYFRLTAISFRVYECLRKKTLLAISGGYLLIFHYPLELIDNLFKYRFARSAARKGFIVIFDRYPADRIAPLTPTYHNKYKRKSLPKKITKILLDVYGHIYKKIYPMPDILFFLNPEGETLMERRADFYQNIEEAYKAKRIYVELYQLLNLKSKCVLDSSLDVKDVLELINRRSK